MATSMEAQLQAVRASLRGREDLSSRPVTRPSVLFDPREAADIDLRTILPIAISGESLPGSPNLSRPQGSVYFACVGSVADSWLIFPVDERAGLDVLVVHDARFGSYRSTLFSHTSLELDREKMEPKDELKVNKSVSSYLRLLSGYMQLPAALKTLEYLIRRFRYASLLIPFHLEFRSQSRRPVKFLVSVAHWLYSNFCGLHRGTGCTYSMPRTWSCLHCLIMIPILLWGSFSCWSSGELECGVFSSVLPPSFSVLMTTCVVDVGITNGDFLRLLSYPERHLRGRS